MRIFVTGATGFIGSALVPRLLQAGHQVLGLTRSEAGAEKLRKTGAEVLYGNIEDLNSLHEGASNSDGVIHLAFNHDFSQFQKNCEDDRKAIVAMGEVLLGSSRPFVMTSGTGIASVGDGTLATEDSPVSAATPRGISETETMKLAERGLKASIVRLPQVHDTHKQGLVPYVTAIAREKRVSAYLGDGGNRWAAAHVSDVSLLYRLVLERAEAGAIYHAVDEEGVSMKDIAEAIGRGLKIPVISLQPEKALSYFGWLSHFAALDMPASSAVTRQKLSWHPSGPSLIADLDGMDYNEGLPA